MKMLFVAAVLTLVTTQSFAARSPLQGVLYNASGAPMSPGQAGGPSSKITCPCSCQCPLKITVINGVRHCPTECLLGTKDGTSTNKGL